MEILALVLACIGFGSLALAMQRHQRQLWHRRLSIRSRRRLLVTGAVHLAGSFVACILHAGWSVGLVLWCGLLTASALLVVLALACVACAREPRP